MGRGTGEDDSVVDRKLVDAQPFQATTLLAPEYDSGRQDGYHTFADLAHRAVDRVDEAASKIDHAPNQIRVGTAKIEQDRNAVANPIGKDLGVTKFLNDQDVCLHVHGSHGSDRRRIIAARTNCCRPRSRGWRLDPTTLDAANGLDPSSLLAPRLDMTSRLSPGIRSRQLVALILSGRRTAVLGTALGSRISLGRTLIGIDGILVDQPRIHQCL